MPATSAARGRLVVFGALIAVLVLLCTGQAAGAAERQPAHAKHAAHSSSTGAARKAAAAQQAAERQASEHRAAHRAAAEHRAALRKAAAHRAALRKAAERKAAEADAMNPSADATRPAAASRAASEDAATRPAHGLTRQRRKATDKDDERQRLADRKQAAADARDNRELDEDSVGSPDSPAAVPARVQRAAQTAAEAAAARLAVARQAAEDLARKQAGQAAGQPISEVGIRSPGSGGSSGAQPSAVGLSAVPSASHPGPAARRATHPSRARSLPHRIIAEPAEPIVALATAGLSVGSAPALLVLAVIAVTGLLLVAAGTRRSSLRSPQHRPSRRGNRR